MQNLSFPKSRRLLKRSEFKNVLDAGQRAADRNLVCVALPTGVAAVRLGIIVSKKVGNAVVRNRVKRHVRERFRHVASDLSGFDLVVIARHGAGERDAQDIHSSFDLCMKRVRLRVSP